MRPLPGARATSSGRWSGASASASGSAPISPTRPRRATCRLFTLIGPAGVGKSRLVADFLEYVDGSARVARGRALSYGEGITYWPLVEILIQLGIDPDEAIAPRPPIRSWPRALASSASPRSSRSCSCSTTCSGRRPPLLDLVEHVADWSREAPIFLLCVARPELLDCGPAGAEGS